MNTIASPRVGFKVYPRKIDIYLFNGSGRYLTYLCSTNASKTCREAKERYAASRPQGAINPDCLRAYFATTSKRARERSKVQS